MKFRSDIQNPHQVIKFSLVGISYFVHLMGSISIVGISPHHKEGPDPGPLYALPGGYTAVCTGFGTACEGTVFHAPDNLASTE